MVFFSSSNTLLIIIHAFYGFSDGDCEILILTSCLKNLIHSTIFVAWLPLKLVGFSFIFFLCTNDFTLMVIVRGKNNSIIILVTSVKETQPVAPENILGLEISDYSTPKNILEFSDSSFRYLEKKLHWMYNKILCFIGGSIGMCLCSSFSGCDLGLCHLAIYKQSRSYFIHLLVRGIRIRVPGTRSLSMQAAGGCTV